MRTSHRNRTLRRRGTKKRRGGKKTRTGKKWTTAIDAAGKTLKKTGNIEAARESLRKQALSNARKLFGAINDH
jgi:hypothetical protein